MTARRVPLRAGRKAKRTLYLKTGADRDRDQLVGLVDTAELAAAIVEAVNAQGGIPLEAAR